MHGQFNADFQRVRAQSRDTQSHSPCEILPHGQLVCAVNVPTTNGRKLVASSRRFALSAKRTISFVVLWCIVLREI